MDDAGDAERAGEAQQVGQETEGDAEDQGSTEGLPQGLPDLLGPLGDGALGPLCGGMTEQTEDERETEDGRKSNHKHLGVSCSGLIVAQPEPFAQLKFMVT